MIEMTYQDLRQETTGTSTGVQNPEGQNRWLDMIFLRGRQDTVKPRRPNPGASSSPSRNQGRQVLHRTSSLTRTADPTRSSRRQERQQPGRVRCAPDAETSPASRTRQ